MAGAPYTARAIVNALWIGEREPRYELGAWVLMLNHVGFNAVSCRARDWSSVETWA